MEFLLGCCAGAFVMYFALKPSLSEREDLEGYVADLEEQIRCKGTRAVSTLPPEERLKHLIDEIKRHP